ncbi:NAC domain-containing protein 68-like [Dorcoceras hygrometricum]|uniref:NAC domain-containing protein 68-like n=1 Tax=Dorcoceras hygrometricum TaxID=472368 RepID=A0A2Z7A3Y1_9LAMI|nr:NAC domain-containing protein 68-like [Dorcoceras hygrometricum]
MEPNQQSPTPANPNQEPAPNMEAAMVTGGVDIDRPGNQIRVTYHKRHPDGEYVQVVLSSGYRLHPHDYELIEDYLMKKINEDITPNIFFPTINIYEHSPNELSEKRVAERYPSVEKDEWYFFSPRERKYMNGNRPSRSAGNGYWKATGADTQIHGLNGDAIGSRKCLVYYQGKAPSGNKTNWVMLEYVASDQTRRQPRVRGDMRLDDCVLCRIYKKSDCLPKTEKQIAAASAAKSRRTKNSAALKIEETEHQGTSQQLNQQQCPPMPSEDVQVTQPNPTRPRQNAQVIQPDLPTQNVEVPQRNQARPQQIGLAIQPNLSTQNVQVPQIPTRPQQIGLVIQSNLPTPAEHNVQLPQPNPTRPQQIGLGIQPKLGQNVQVPQPNPTRPQQIDLVIRHNLPTAPQQQQQNMPATQYSLHAGSHNLGGQFENPMNCIPHSQQNQFDNQESSLEPFLDEWNLMDIDANLSFTSTYPNRLGYVDILDENSNGFGHLGFPSQNFHHFLSQDFFDHPGHFVNWDHPSYF